MYHNGCTPHDLFDLIDRHNATSTAACAKTHRKLQFVSFGVPRRSPFASNESPFPPFVPLLITAFWRDRAYISAETSAKVRVTDHWWPWRH